MGHEAPFAFDTDYRPAPGIERQLCGTPSVLAMAALEVGVEILTRADLTRVREKSQRMGDLFLQLVDEQCNGLGLSPACPRDSEKRGSQVSLHHAESYPIMQALIARGVIGDFRAPDVLRFGFTPALSPLHRRLGRSRDTERDSQGRSLPPPRVPKKPARYLISNSPPMYG